MGLAIIERKETEQTLQLYRTSLVQGNLLHISPGAHDIE
jgi:hypothetical protein